MTQVQILERSVLAVLILGACLFVYHILFRRASFSWQRMDRLQNRLRYTCLSLVFVGPTLWLAGNIPGLHEWIEILTVLLYYGLVMSGVEIFLCFLLERHDGLRVDATFSALVRFGLYFAIGLVPLSVMLGLPMFDSEFQARVGIILVLALALHLSYTYIFKWLPWHHPLALALRSRLRLWVYFLMLGSILYFACVDLGLLQAQSDQATYSRAALGVLFGSLLFEAFLVCLFDYYFPDVRGFDVPTLFRDLARGVGFPTILALSAVWILNKDLSSLLLGSAVISVGVGFALQETLGNFFAGLALRLARPYTLGDRIEIQSLSGIVQKIDWRSTAIMTNQGDLLIVPNSKLAQELITNHSAPVSTTGRFIEVGVHYRHAPNRVKEVLLESCAAVPEVLREPAPEVYVMSFADSSITYRLRLFIRDFAERFRIDSKVREAIWYQFSRAGLEIPYPIRNVYYRKPDGGIDTEREVRSLLDEVDFFSELDDKDLARLGHRAHFQLYAAGERICVQGQPGSSFYIIKSGLIRVSAVDSDGEVFLSIELKPGQYFGEMALLTGEPRSATVTALTETELIRLGKEDMRSILKGNPQVEELISKVLAQRKLKTAKARVEAEEERISRAMSASESSEGVEQLTQQFLRRIRDFFSY